MNQETELQKLESFVSKLLQNFKELKEENGRLTQELQVRDETIVSLREQLTANDIERNEIGSRVNTLIEQIEEWEVDLGEDVFSAVPNSDASRQGNLFSAVEDTGENETGEQQDTSTSEF